MDKNIYIDDFRTDLAIENYEYYENKDIDGVNINNFNYQNGKIVRTKVEITNKNGSLLLGKPIGNYETIECKMLNLPNVEIHDAIIEILVNALKEITNINKVQNVLVVGLGNLYITPDSLGQKVCQKLLVTRHFYDDIDKSLGIRCVSSITPGVLGQTGIESSKIVKNVINEVKPDLIIVVDALCARSSDRINTTIQLSDSGITPGFGVNNKRMVLSEETLGVKVISIGIPTVIESKTLVNDAILTIFDNNNNIFEQTCLSNDLKRDIIHEVLGKMPCDMYVTPKEIDEIIVRLASIISRSLNKVLHDGLTEELMTTLLY